MLNINTSSSPPATPAEVVQATLEETIGTLDALPDNVLVTLVKMLDLPDLESFRLCSNFWATSGKADWVWKAVAKYIGCPLRKSTEFFPFMKQVKHSISVIEATAEKYDEIFLLDQQQIEAKSSFLERIKHQRELLIAKDVLTVWLKLGVAINPQATEVEIYGEELPESNPQHLLDKASQFNIWFTAHQDELHLLTALDLNDCELIHVPDQICQLPNLTKLDLGNNRLRIFPWELKALPNLVELYIYQNPIDGFLGEMYEQKHNLVFYLDSRRG